MRKGLFLLLLVGCASTPEPFHVQGNTYTVTDIWDDFRPLSKTREDLFRQSQEFCLQRGATFNLVDERTYRSRYGLDTTIDLTFECVPWTQ